MFFVILSFTFQVPYLNSKLQNPIVEQVDAPAFQSFGGDENKLYAENANRDITINKDYSKMLRPHVYYRSSVTVTKCTLDSNFALGGGADSANGGAIFLSWSMLSMEGSSSTSRGVCSNNQAQLGGAICCLTSPVHIIYFNFLSNKAYMYGGFIYFQGAYLEDKSRLSSTHKMYIQYSELGYNNAFQSGGAIATVDTEEIYIEHIKGYYNKTTFNGGCMYAYNTNNIKLFEANFIGNQINAMGLIGKKYNRKTFPGKNNFDPHFRVRGGGAIYFASDNKFKIPANSPATSTEKRSLTTNQCCFSGNVADQYSTSFGKGVGNALLFEGYCYWLSNQDSIKGLTMLGDHDPNWKYFVAYNAKEYTDNPDSAFLCTIQTTNVDRCLYEGRDWSNDNSSPLTSEYIPSKISPSNTGNDSFVSDVPSPSEYTYVATPISSYPKATKDRKLITPARTWREDEYPFLSVTTRSLLPTAAITPFQTAYETPFSTAETTAYETPFSTAETTAFETVYETPFLTEEPTSYETPFSTAETTAYETAYETPYLTEEPTAFETVYETPFLTEEPTAYETPYLTEEPTAFETVYETPFLTEEPTSYETPFSTAETTAYETAYETPYLTEEPTAFETVYETPFLTEEPTAYETPYLTEEPTAFETAYETPFITPDESKAVTPFSTAHITPFETAFSTAHTTPFDTAFETAFETPFSTAHSTAFETPFSTAHSTAFETAYETPFSTAFETAYETPFSTPFETAFETVFETPLLTPVETTPETTPAVIVVPSSDNGAQIDNSDNFRIIVENKWIIVIIVAVIVILLLIILLAIIIWMILPKNEQSSDSDSIELPDDGDWGSVEDSGETVDVSDVDIDNDGAIAAGLFDKEISDVSDSGETIDISDNDVDEAADADISGILDYGESLD